MIDIRKFDTLGHANHGWLDARHHFSFANYHDPDRMGWGALRVWNDDAIAAQPDAWEKFCAGEGKAMGALVGHIMKASRGQADGKLVSQILNSRKG